MTGRSGSCRWERSPTEPGQPGTNKTPDVSLKGLRFKTRLTWPAIRILVSVRAAGLRYAGRFLFAVQGLPGAGTKDGDVVQGVDGDS